jgi:hypothetical protein
MSADTFSLSADKITGGLMPTMVQTHLTGK